MKIRTTKTASGSTAIQVVKYVQRKKVILKHIGSAKNDEEIVLLKNKALRWIIDNDNQGWLFKEFLINTQDKLGISGNKSEEYSNNLVKSNFRSVGVKYQILYEVLSSLINEFNFRSLDKNVNQLNMMIDLVIARIVFPSSKFESLQLLDQYFGLKYSYRTLSRNFKYFSNIKDDIEFKIVNFAKEKIRFDFNFVFYDLTTLYFESFKDDDLRKNGFSKDNKINQPQIMIGLLVNKEGFPISYQIFPGNKFEGHTMIPIINDLLKKYQIKKSNITFVADAAMINNDNIDYLLAHNLNFIVGARIANLNESLISDINDNLDGEDNKIYRINDQKQLNCHLITHFSNSRYRKDKSDVKKQIIKANNLLKTSDPSQIRKRSKFLQKSQENNQKYQINSKLIDKTTKLLGIKGYYTNIQQENSQQLTDSDIINRYRNLWQVEKSFRISKSDLKMRPIYHYQECTIKSHILICFMALAIAKYIEIKTNQSIKSVIKTLKTRPNSIIINKNTGEEIVLDAQINKEINELKNKLECGTNLS